MKITLWPIDKPIPYPKNARKITDAAIQKVATSIKEYGWQQPVVVDSEDVIIAGHTRILAARHLGLDKVPVLVAAHLTESQVKAYRLMDNRSHDETKWDYEMLGAELVDLKAIEFDLNLTGFEQFEIDPILGATWSPDKPSGDLESDHQRGGGHVISITNEQKVSVDAAVAAMREQDGDSELTPGSVVERLCDAYLAGEPLHVESETGVSS